MVEEARKGRQRTVSDDTILKAAFEAFAAEGYESMSVRGLNLDLGLSHETVRQRFGSKSELFFAAVDYGVAKFYTLLFEEIALRGDAENDVQELRFAVQSFMAASIKFPLLAQLVNHEAGHPSQWMDYIFTVGFVPGMTVYGEILNRLVDQGVIHPITARDVFFLVDAGFSPYAQVGLSRAFDVLSGPFDESTHVERFIDFLFRGLLKDPGA